MPRIFKGSESTLRLLIHKCNHYNSISDLKIVLFTGEDIDNHIEVVDGINVDGNMAVITLPARAFNNLEEGVINYIVEGVIDGDLFATERQSNYYLKTPLSYVVDDSLQIKDEYITENGNYTIYPDGTYDGMSQVNLFVEVPDTNGSYDEGYNIGRGEGYNDGYANGQNDGYNSGREEVISQAESLYLTENGVYEGENLYNRIEVAVDIDGQYVKGYEDGANAASADAIVLDATKNGTYYTKYADIPEWTEPETGDDFFSYALLTNNTYFNTGYVGDNYSVVEFWYKHDDSILSNSLGTLIGKQGTDGVDVMKIRVDTYNNAETFTMEKAGDNSKDFIISKDEWHKIRFSYEGVWVDDEKVVSYTSPIELTNNIPFCINGSTGWEYGANGYYGIVKIDDNTYIPTLNGYINRDTGEPLEIKGKDYQFYSIERPTCVNNLIKQVNVEAKINVAAEKIRFGYANFTQIPTYFDFKDVTDWSSMFYSSSLTNLYNPTLLNAKPKSLSYCFYGCKNITDWTPLSTWDTSNTTDMGSCFSATTISDFSFIENWDTSNVKEFKYMLSSTVVKCPAINVQGKTSKNSYPVHSYSDIKTFTDFGGFLNMKWSSDDAYCLAKCPNLTYESCINVLNALYDFTGNGETPNSSQGVLKVHANFLTTVGEEITIGTNKGWTITA